MSAIPCSCDPGSGRRILPARLDVDVRMLVDHDHAPFGSSPGAGGLEGGFTRGSGSG